MAPVHEVASVSEVEIVLEKPHKDSSLGILLSGDGHPYIDEVASGALAHGKLRLGDQVLLVNGWDAAGHSQTAKRFVQLTGVIIIRVLRRAAAAEEEVFECLRAKKEQTCAGLPRLPLPCAVSARAPSAASPEAAMATNVSELLAARGPCIPGTSFKQYFREHHGFVLDLGKGKLQDFLKRCEGLGVCKLEMRPMPSGPRLLFVHAVGEDMAAPNQLAAMTIRTDKLVQEAGGRLDEERRGGLY